MISYGYLVEQILDFAEQQLNILSNEKRSVGNFVSNSSTMQKDGLIEALKKVKDMAGGSG
jgi:hypothetical protein